MAETILSAGIDIGTSTTQVIFSRITLRNEAGETLVPRIRITEKQVLYRSPLYFTPLRSPTEIDAEQVRALVMGEYENAGIKPADLATGAVIITGETARKKNAEEVVRVLSGLAGDFVVATAGPDLESVLSGRGAGTAQYSEQYGVTAVNLDIGGGTTNISVFQNGVAVDTGCLDVGGRLIRLAPDGRTIQYIAPKIQALAETLDIAAVEGSVLERSEVEQICTRMAQLLEEAVGLRPASEWLERIATNHTLKQSGRTYDRFTFSGGVADCVYHPEKFTDGDFGDIGVELGRAVRNTSFFTEERTMVPKETIRATVVGAGNHSMELSGSTITYTETDFPLRDIPVLKIQMRSVSDIPYISERLERQFGLFHHGGEPQDVAVAMMGMRNPDFYQIEDLADALFQSLSSWLGSKGRWIILLETDMGKALGLALKRRIRNGGKLICIDNVHVEDGDYIDIGSPVASGRVLPVVVKTLIFI